MAYQEIIYAKDGNIATITLNKPEKLNTWSFEGGMTEEFYRSLTEAEDDDDVKVAVIKGAGRSFSAGHDLGEVGFVYGYGTGKPGERRPSQRIRLKLDQEMMIKNHRRLLLFPKITIAQVHGHCVGEGVVVMECCDLAIAAEDAKLSHADQRMGFAGSGNGNISTLIAHVGLKRALFMLLTGDAISGKEAAEIGLVCKAVPADRLEDEVNKLAQAICRMPRDGIAIGKAHRALAYESMGITAGYMLGVLTHTLFTNVRWESDEYNFFRQRREEGLRAAIHKRNERFDDLLADGG